jgi:hypothetical protein
MRAPNEWRYLLHTQVGSWIFADDADPESLLPACYTFGMVVSIFFREDFHTSFPGLGEHLRNAV